MLALSLSNGWGFSFFGLNIGSELLEDLAFQQASLLLSVKEGFSPDIAVLVLAMLLDLTLGEVFPARLHPVVWMGKVVHFLQRLAPTPAHRHCPNPQGPNPQGLEAPQSQTGPSSHGRSGQWSSRPWGTKANLLEFIFGLALALLVPGAFAAAAYFALESLRTLSGIGYILVAALVLKSTFAVSMLDRSASQVYRGLEEGRLDDARADLRSLVSRDTSSLTPELTTAAAVESVAENTTDSFVAPWLAFALFGIPGAVAYRAINTLDSMIGYQGVYEYLGKAAARLDDLVNLIPARLSALLILAGDIFHPRGLRKVKNAWLVMWRDHARSESPNAGWTMSSMAGVLGVQLEKVSHYRLGDGGTTALVPQDIKRTIQRMYFVVFSGLFLTIGIILIRHVLF